MILDVEASLFPHVLHIVGQVAYQALFAQLRRDRCFQGDDIAPLLGGDKARACGGDYFNFIRGKFDLLAIDGEVQMPGLVEQPGSLLCAMSDPAP